MIEFINKICQSIVFLFSFIANTDNNNENDETKKKTALSEEKSTISNSVFKIPTFGPFSSTSGVAASLDSKTDKTKISFNFGTSNPGTTFSNSFLTSTPIISKTIKEDINQDIINQGSAEGDDEDAPPKVSSIEHSETDSVITKKYDALIC